MITDGSALAKWRVTSWNTCDGEVAAVGELDALRAAVGAGLDDLLTDLDIRVDRKPG